MRAILIGNANVLSPPLQGYDVVVRMNLQGGIFPCDLWVNSLRYRQAQPDTDRKILRLNYMRGGGEAKEFPVNWEEQTTHWSCDEYEKMRKKLGLHRPTTGLMAIYYMIENTDYTIDVAGFTHEGAEVHDWDKEREIINNYESQGLINTIWR